MSCAYQGCDFQSENDSEAVACARLRSHAFLHTSVPAPAVNAAAQDSCGPKLERPKVTIGISMEYWNIFTHCWRVFKDGYGLAETYASVQLFQCAGRELGDSQMKSDANIVTLLSANLFTAMQRLAVIPIATGIRRSELKQMRQIRDKTFRSFAAHVRGKANICALGKLHQPHNLQYAFELHC